MSEIKPATSCLVVQCLNHPKPPRASCLSTCYIYFWCYIFVSSIIYILFYLIFVTNMLLTCIFFVPDYFVVLPQNFTCSLYLYCVFLPISSISHIILGMLIDDSRTKSQMLSYDNLVIITLKLKTKQNIRVTRFSFITFYRNIDAIKFYNFETYIVLLLVFTALYEAWPPELWTLIQLCLLSSVTTLKLTLPSVISEPKISSKYSSFRPTDLHICHVFWWKGVKRNRDEKFVPVS